VSATTWDLGLRRLRRQELMSGEELEEERNKKMKGEKRKAGFGEEEM